MDNRNPYEVLGVSPDASFDEIRAVYRALSLRFHPDRATGLPDPARDAAEVQMKALNAAYTVLKDPGKRAALDRKLAKKRAVAPPPPRVPEVDPEPPAWPSRVSVRIKQEGPTRYTPATPYAAYQPPTAPGFVIYPPYMSPPAAPDIPAPVSGGDMVRFFLVAGLTSLGWFGVVLIDMILPPLFTLMAALGLGWTLTFALAFIKPAHKRQPLSAAGLLRRGLLLTLFIPLGVIAAVVFPKVTADIGSATFQLVFQMAGMAFVLALHWGVCLASYRLS